MNGDGRYIITVDRSRIDAGRPNAVRVEDTKYGTIQNVSRATLTGLVTIMEGMPRQDGARVWIEADGVAL